MPTLKLKLEPKNAEPEPSPTFPFGGNGNAHNAFDLLLPMMRKMWAEWRQEVWK